MQTCCPKCTTMVRSNTATEWEISKQACSELLGTEWADRPEFCPILSQVVEPDVTLPGVPNRAVVQAEIDRLRLLLQF